MDNGSIFVKFSDYVDSIQKGKLYMNNLKYYIEQEIKTGIQGQGDKLEAQIPIHQTVITNNTTQTKINVTKSFGYELFPVFCVSVLTPINVSNGKGYYKLTDAQNLEFSKFARSCITIKCIDEFISRFDTACKKHEYEYSHAKVEYCDFFNPYKKIKDLINENSFVACFCKDNRFFIQREYRFIIHKEVEDFLELDIGDISDISQVCKNCFN